MHIPAAQALLASPHLAHWPNRDAPVRMLAVRWSPTPAAAMHAHTTSTPGPPHVLEEVDVRRRHALEEIAAHQLDAVANWDVWMGSCPHLVRLLNHGRAAEGHNGQVTHGGFVQVRPRPRLNAWQAGKQAKQCPPH